MIHVTLSVFRTLKVIFYMALQLPSTTYIITTSSGDLKNSQILSVWLLPTPLGNCPMDEIK